MDLGYRGVDNDPARARGTAHKGGLPNMTNICLRPPEVAARIVPGHWEGAC